jgi:ATPase subunit of ABC transporter with duplicated ATPase domains
MVAKPKTFNPDLMPAVSLLEIEAASGLPVEVLRNRLNGTPTARDWAGRVVIPAAEARTLLQEIEDERREAEELEAERQAAERAAEAQRRQRYEDLLREELEKEARRVMQELQTANVTFLGVTPPLSPADRRRAAERARQRLEKEA